MGLGGSTHLKNGSDQGMQKLETEARALQILFPHPPRLVMWGEFPRLYKDDWEPRKLGLGVVMTAQRSSSEGAWQWQPGEEEGLEKRRTAGAPRGSGC